MDFWLLAISYWIHLLATVVWLGGLTVMVLVAWPAVRHRTLLDNQWLALQQRLSPLNNGSLVLLLVTGFYQMTQDPNYHGFLEVDSVWAGAILLKHIAVVGMMGVGAYLQMRLYPAVQRTLLWAEKRPTLATADQEKLKQQEIYLLRLNLACAGFVLLFTAIATAV